MYKELEAIRDRGEEDMTLFEFLKMKNRLFESLYDSESSMSMRYKKLPVKWIIDNNLTQRSDLYKAEVGCIPLDEIRCIYIAPYSTGYEADMSIADRPIAKVFIFLHTFFSSESQKGLRRTFFQGFNTPETFKMEDYTNLPPVEDFRRTLYWNPNVTTDKNGKAKIEFFNNSSCKHLFISAEGLSEDGKVIVY